MPPITDKDWKIVKTTADTPFKPGTNLSIGKADAAGNVTVTYTDSTTSATVTVTGAYNSAQNKVTVVPSSDEYWELVGSATRFRGSKFVLSGMCWMSTQPDAMGAVVCDPQS